MMKDEIIKGVFIKKGKKEGKTIAIFGGIHGNEDVGVKMIDKLCEKLEIDTGTVYLAYGNLEAIKKNKRFTETNLNRCFDEDNGCKTYEEKRAQELMSVLDKCEALLDLHSFTNPYGEPFAICEENAFDIARQFDVGVVSSGWSKMGGGNDGYMYNQGKVGICLECGPHYKLNESMQRAELAVDSFLKYFNLS